MSALDVPGRLPTLLTVPEFAAETRLSRAGVYNLIARGTISAVKIGRSVRIPLSELQRITAGGDA